MAIEYKQYPFHVTPWGAIPPEPERTFDFVDLSAQDSFHYGDHFQVTIDAYHPEWPSEFALLVQAKESKQNANSFTSETAAEQLVVLGFNQEQVSFAGIQYKAHGLGVRD